MPEHCPIITEKDLPTSEYGFITDPDLPRDCLECMYKWIHGADAAPGMLEYKGSEGSSIIQSGIKVSDSSDRNRQGFQDHRAARDTIYFDCTAQSS